MLNSKQDRAQIIIAKVIELDKEHGCTIPARGFAGTAMARLVQAAQNCRATLTSNQRITFARQTEDNVGERRLNETGGRLFELEVHDRTVLVANLRGTEIHLHSYVPGKWESWFGVDNGGDTVPLDRTPFADPNSAEWQAVQQSSDYLLPPLREAPREEKIGDNPFRRGAARRKRLR